MIQCILIYTWIVFRCQVRARPRNKAVTVATHQALCNGRPIPMATEVKQESERERDKGGMRKERGAKCYGSVLPLVCLFPRPSDHHLALSDPCSHPTTAHKHTVAGEVCCFPTRGMQHSYTTGYSPATQGKVSLDIPYLSRNTSVREKVLALESARVRACVCVCVSLCTCR